MSTKLSRKRPHDVPDAMAEDGHAVSRTGGRRNFTRAEVAPLASWFQKNIHWPYPDKARKQELATASGLTPDQVQHWFINARMRGHVRECTFLVHVSVCVLSKECISRNPVRRLKSQRATTKWLLQK